MSRKGKIGLVLGIFVVLIVAARIAAEHYVLVYVNKTLDELDGYHGHVDDIDLHIYRGAYEAENIVIEKEGKDDHKRTPFIAIDKVDLSVQWAALFDGAIVGEIELLHPQVNYVAEKKTRPRRPKSRATGARRSTT